MIRHDRGDGAAFDETRVGSITLRFVYGITRRWKHGVEHLDALGVPHSGIQEEHGPAGPLIVLRDPDNIQLKLTAGWQLTA